MNSYRARTVTYSACIHGLLVVLLLAPEFAQGQADSSSAMAVPPLVQFLRADSASGLRALPTDAIFFEVGALLPSTRQTSLDSTPPVPGMHLGIASFAACSVGINATGVTTRALCALRDFDAYVETGRFTRRDSTGDATVWVVLPSNGRQRSRGVPQTVAATVGKVVGRAGSDQRPISFHAYEVRVVLRDGAWIVQALRSPSSVPANRTAPSGAP